MASLKWFRKRSCTSKIRHKTKATANKHAARLNPVHSYFCRFCRGFHVGHKSKR